MVKGLTKTSETVAIGFNVAESAANTFTQSSVDLNLSPLDREVFVVTAINLDPTPPDALGGANTRVNTALSTTSQTSVPNLDNSNCLSTANIFFRGAGLVDSVGVYSTMAEQPPATLDYLGIIATNDFFIQIQGDGNASAKSVFGKPYG